MACRNDCYLFLTVLEPNVQYHHFGSRLKLVIYVQTPQSWHQMIRVSKRSLKVCYFRMIARSTRSASVHMWRLARMCAGEMILGDIAGADSHYRIGQIESNYDEITDSFDAMNLKSELLRGISSRPFDDGLQG
jgi:hypothetical protein